MIEYFMIGAFLLLSYFLLQNKALKSRKWFAYAVHAIALAAIILLVLDEGKQLGFIKMILLIAAMAGIVFTAIKRTSVVEKKD
ncbi:MAG TPA: hypothetical protein VGD17_03970 [Chitinophagaceae bacterium]